MQHDDTPSSIPVGYCQCGCGQITGNWRGIPSRFVPGHHRRLPRLHDDIRHADGTVSIALYSTRYPGLFARVDAVDYERVSAFRWNPSLRDGQMYASSTEPGGTPGALYLHRFITGAAAGQLVDHRNRNGLDCRRENLRFATSQQNAQNSSRSDALSQYRGLNPTPHGWAVRIRSGNQVVWLGRHEDEEFAARVYDAAARDLHGEFAYLNFPDDPTDPDAYETWKRFEKGPSFSSQYRGVTRDRRSGNWVAQIRHQSQHYRIGTYRSEIEAARAFDAKVRELRGPDAPTNFPE